MPSSTVTTLAAALMAAPLLTAQAAGQLPPPPDPQPTGLEDLDPVMPNIVLPDLTVETFNAPGCATQGQAIGPQLEAKVRNIGAVDLNEDISVGFYLSPEPVIAGFNTLLDGGREHVAGLDSGESKPVDLAPSMSIPTSYPTGPAHIGVKVDDWDNVAETDETNNTMTVPIQINSTAQTCP